MKKRLFVAFSSHRGTEYDNEFSKHIIKTSGLRLERIITYPVPNFGVMSLPEAYNSAWEWFDKNKPASFEDSILLFIHNDIKFRTHNWGFRLLEIFNNEDFDIIGLAGSDFFNDNGVWWHDSSRCFGIVNHTDGKIEWTTQFSQPLPKTKEVVIIDGIFIAVDPETIKQRFDTEYKGFHHYDTSFVFPNFLDGCNVGVTTQILVCHESVGRVNQEWENNRQQFSTQYADQLPYDLNLQP